MFYRVQSGHLIYMVVKLAMKRSQLLRMIRRLERQGLQLSQISTRDLPPAEVRARGYGFWTSYDIREPWRVERR